MVAKRWSGFFSLVMKFLIDENVPQSLIQYLLSSGYDCLDIKTTPRRGMSDEHVAQWASTEDRIILDI